MREKILGSLRSNMDILISRLDVFILFQFKDNLTDSTVWNTGETGDINTFRRERYQFVM